MAVNNDKIVIASILQEARVLDPKKREIMGVILTAGVSQRKNYYSPEVVEAATPMFEGVKMYIDHPAEKDAGKARSIRDWGATILETYYEPDAKRTMARIGIRDPWLWENRIVPGSDGGFLDEIGISINAVGPTKIGNMEGQNVRIVEGIRKVYSADFVAEASAGGKVTEILESAQPIQEDIMGLENLTIEELADVRPDLVEAIIQESINEFGQDDPIDVEIGEALLESQVQIADSIAALREDTAYVVDEFLEGLQMIQQDLGVVMEGVEYDDEEYDDTQLVEGVQYEQPNEYYVDTAPEIYEYLENLTESQQVLAEENERLRENMSLLTSQTLIERKLMESNLPEHAQDRIREALYHRTSEEMDAIIDGERKYLGIIIEDSGGVPIVGAGGEASYEEFQESQNVAAQQRLDYMFGLDEK